MVQNEKNPLTPNLLQASLQAPLRFHSDPFWGPLLLLSASQPQSQCHVCWAFVTAAPFFWYHNPFQ